METKITVQLKKWIPKNANALYYLEVTSEFQKPLYFSGNVGDLRDTADGKTIVLSLNGTATPPIGAIKHLVKFGENNQLAEKSDKLWLMLEAPDGTEIAKFLVGGGLDPVLTDSDPGEETRPGFGENDFLACSRA